MNVKTLCLAILFDGEATGYEIRKQSTEGEYSYFVEASFGSIYPALARLEADGLVTSRTELQEGRPAKRIYVITEAGRRAFRQSLFDQLGPDIFRSEFFLFARFAAELPAGLVEARLNERLAELKAQRDKLDAHLENISHAGDAWVIRYGIACLEAGLRHIEAHKDELKALAKPEITPANAAE
jgi:PadR family transcriptional regulator, regulatory protein AphA